MSIAQYFRRRFIFWVVVLGLISLAYWLAIYLTRPIGYQKGAFREYETSSGVCIQMPNFSIVYELDCFRSVWPKHIASPGWAAVQEVRLRDQGCTVVVRSFTYERGSAEREMKRWVSDLTEDRALLQERATVSGHPALKLSAPGTLYLFVVWDDTKLLEMQADGCRDEEHQRCLRKLMDSLELR
ncbi:MAG: hypothetical protein KatS3mg022_2470 [Armatimonadota bacterium]|nr:MAG: hypothetical protein KatS3mg022_2470 [Armatimonadota bacterium]